MFACVRSCGVACIIERQFKVDMTTLLVAWRIAYI